MKEIEYNNEREISKLIIVDAKGKVRYEMGKRVDPPREKSKSIAEIEFETALNELNKSLSITELQTTWAKYVKYQTNEIFKTAKDTLKIKLS